MIFDISKWQGYIDWESFSKECDFVIMRASVNKDKDTKYDRNVRGATNYNVPYHAYHYLSCRTVKEAEENAKAFYNAVKDSNPLFLVVDCENGKITYQCKHHDKLFAQKAVTAFVEKVEELYKKDGGICPRWGVYIGHHVYTCWKVHQLPYWSYIWIPRSGGNKPNWYCDLWQYGQLKKGKVPGVKATIDVNRLNGIKTMEFFKTFPQKEYTYTLDTTDLSTIKDLQNKYGGTIIEKVGE